MTQTPEDDPMMRILAGVVVAGMALCGLELGIGESEFRAGVAAASLGWMPVLWVSIYVSHTAAGTIREMEAAENRRRR